MLLNNWKGFGPDIMDGGNDLPWQELDGRVAGIILNAITHLDGKTDEQIARMADGIATLFKVEWPGIAKDFPDSDVLVSHQSALFACIRQAGLPIDNHDDLLAVLALMLVSDFRRRAKLTIGRQEWKWIKKGEFTYEGVLDYQGMV